MARYAIMRTRKLKTDGNVGASLAHAWRDRETPNADQAKTPENYHTGANSRAEAMAKYRALLPEKVRKNGVRCIEYLVTYSPDALRKPEDKSAYFNAALDWLRAKHGKALFYAGIHIDEKTPHLYAYAVPLDARGKLNCRSFLGGREKLSALQDEFHEAVGKTVGLDRGIRGSRARHQTLRSFYGRIQNLDAAITPPRRGVTESAEKYAERYKDQVRPLVAAAATTEQVRARNVQLETHVSKSKRGFQEYTALMDGLTPEQRQAVERTIAGMREETHEAGRRATQTRQDGKSHGKGR